MAKLTSKRFKEVARLAATLAGTRYLFVLRSDGKVLRRATGEYGTGYSIWTQFPKNMTAGGDPDERLRKLVEGNGYEVVK